MKSGVSRTAEQGSDGSQPLLSRRLRLAHVASPFTYQIGTLRANPHGIHAGRREHPNILVGDEPAAISTFGHMTMDLDMGNYSTFYRHCHNFHTSHRNSRHWTLISLSRTTAPDRTRHTRCSATGGFPLPTYSYFLSPRNELSGGASEHGARGNSGNGGVSRYAVCA